VFQFQCGRAPSQAGYRSKAWWAVTPPTTVIGRDPLLKPIARFLLRIFPSGRYAVLAPVSRGYSPLQGRLVTCYSPGRHCTHPLAGTFSFDLHVLGTPPALILSQDQTLV